MTGRIALDNIPIRTIFMPIPSRRQGRFASVTRRGREAVASLGADASAGRGGPSRTEPGSLAAIHQWRVTNGFPSRAVRSKPQTPRAGRRVSRPSRGESPVWLLSSSTRGRGRADARRSARPRFEGQGNAKRLGGENASRERGGAPFFDHPPRKGEGKCLRASLRRRTQKPPAC
jgi:hypothetical protein